jgi:prepilin-type N-terminal cleavage/methylation domain-containing protein
MPIQQPRTTSARGISGSAGFTLIELLVVIAIIGLLAALVLIALHSTRTKAYDARIKSGVDQLRALGEVYYHNNNFSFSGYDVCLATPIAVNCPGNLEENIQVLKSELDYSGSSELAAAASSTDFCVGAPLATDSDLVFCKDSDGHAGITAAATACGGAVCTPTAP